MDARYLGFDEHLRIDWMLEWIKRMTEKYGATVYAKDGSALDWGQALHRECYGKDWQHRTPSTPTWRAIECAKAWESGKLPDWLRLV